MTDAADSGRPAPRAVRIERHGGLAGLHIDTTHDYASLRPDQQEALARLIDAKASKAASGARAMPPAPQPGADRFSYRIHVEDAAGGEQVLEVSDDDMPRALEPLAKPELP